MVGRIGHDLFGDFLLEQLALAGVETRYVQRDSRVGTALTVVLLQNNGDRNFLYYPGAGAHLTAQDVTDEALSQCYTLVVGSAFGLPALDGEGLVNVLARARSLGVTTVVDTTWDTFGRWLRVLEPVLPHLDLFVPSYYEAKALVGDGTPEEVAARLAALGPSAVIVKLGAAGCFLHSAERQWHIPALPSQVVDTTGAGDCFVGGFLAARARGWDLYESARFGHAAAACCVEQIGATSGVRNWEQVYARFLAA
jgi:sugar/nucleoside kinase (ribokinase family)